MGPLRSEHEASVSGRALFDLDVSHPYFHSFFEIDSLDIVPQAYNAGRPIFRGLFEDNDKSKRLQMMVNYNTDISQFWEWSSVGVTSDRSNQRGIRLGVNFVIYGMTHWPRGLEAGAGGWGLEAGGWRL